MPRRRSLSGPELTERVCSIDDRVLFCAIIGARGEITATASRPGYKSVVTDKEVDILAKRWAIIRGIDDTADKSLGPARSAVIFRKKITLMSVSAREGGSVFVGARPDFDAARIKEIEKLVGSNGPGK
jgi:hypothetical protein